MNIRFMSRFDFGRAILFEEASSNIKMISINDTSDEFMISQMVLEDEGFVMNEDFILLMFDDCDSEEGMSELQAKTVMKFINDNPLSDWLIHCYAGVSRSAAIAKFINEYLKAGIKYLEDYNLHNRRVYGMLQNEAGMDTFANYVKELKAQEAMEKNDVD